jgi:c-di-GMP-binding flagellar brake protein YcgR
MLEQSPQHRRFTRIAEHLPVSFRVRGLQELSHTLTENLSIGGAGLRSEKYVRPQALLDLDLQLESRVVHAVGRVAWTQNMLHADRVRFGVEFIECDPRDAEYVTDFIEKRLNGPRLRTADSHS